MNLSHFLLRAERMAQSGKFSYFVVAASDADEATEKFWDARPNCQAFKRVEATIITAVDAPKHIHDIFEDAQ